MTPEKLENIVRNGNPTQIADALAPLTEAERKKLAKPAANLAKTIKKDFEERVSTGDRFDWRSSHRLQMRARLAVLALCSWTDVARFQVDEFFFPRAGTDQDMIAPCIERILKERKPDWLDKWAERELNKDWPNWDLMRRLIRAGFLQQQTSDRYIIAMIRSNAGRRGDDEPLIDALRADPALLENEIWRIFEVDPGKDTLLPSDLSPDARYQPKPGHTWSHSLATLATTGEIDRNRLLTASLTALNRQLHHTNTTWFVRFHEFLEPSAAERTARQRHYLDLLVNTVPAVVGFALDALKVVAKEGGLDVESFIDAVAPVFDLRPKTHPAAAVQLLKLAFKQSPDLGLAPRIAFAASRGLGHPSPDVQKACLDLIETIAKKSPIDADLADALNNQRELITASLRDRFDAIFNSASDTRAHNSNRNSNSNSNSTNDNATSDNAHAPRHPASLAVLASPASVNDELTALIAEAESLPLVWREKAEVDACLAALRATDPPPALNFDPMSVPRLDPAAALVPIRSLDELLERLYAAVESLESSDELDLLLDGISRFADERPDDFPARTAPLLKRVGERVDPGGFAEATFDLQRLIAAWLNGKSLQLPGPPPLRHAGPGLFLKARMAELSQRLTRTSRRRAGPLFACPTHPGGWIDPLALIDRLHDWQSRGDEHPGRLDLIQAILRLAPDHREQAAAAAQSLAGESAAAVRYALGRAEPIGTDISLWIAASRARHPKLPAPDLATAGGNQGPDSALPADYSQWLAQMKKNYSSLHYTINIPIELTQDHTKIDRPLTLFHRSRDWFSFTNVGTLRCEAAIWPANPDAFMLGGARAMLERLDSPASTFSPLAPFLEPLFDPDSGFTEMARLALAAGLLSKDAGARGTAVDAMIALIQDGRCTGDELGAVFVKLAAAPGLVRLNRLAAALAEVARVSPLHRHAAAGTLQSLLVTMQPPLPKDLHHLLSPLNEWLIETGQPLREDAQKTLALVEGGGKTATLAHALLKRNAPRDPARFQPVLIESLRARIDRARRWMEREKI